MGLSGKLMGKSKGTLPMDDRISIGSDIPLVVDLDGTLFKVDTLHEALIHLFSRNPIQAIRSLSNCPQTWPCSI